MARLRESQLRAALEFLREAGASDGSDPFPRPMLEALTRLVRCDVANFCELDRGREQVMSDTESTGDHFKHDQDSPEQRRAWRLLAQHPVCTYQTRTGRFEAIRLSDLIARRQLHRLELYAEAHRPAGIEYQLVAGISSSTRYTKTFLFHRSRPDFSERDRLVLDLLRPHLANLFRRFIERRSLAEVTSNLGTDLSTRELEVLRYVAKGYANAEVAGILWITTSTVRKHLEHIYDKLGVNSRTAAVARVFPPTGG